MTNFGRRDFLKLASGAAGTTAGMSLLSGSISRALALPAAQSAGTIQDVKHVVILMQENRSFDHYFGAMRGVRGFGDRHPVPMESGKPVWSQSDGKREIPPYHLDTEKTSAMQVPGTPHSFSDSQAAWNQGKFGYWPKYKNPFSMGYYRREDIPFQYALAEAFTICDAYHCSITTGTDPNRIVFWSGSNHDPVLRAQGINGTEENSEPNNLRSWVKGRLPDPGYTYQGSALTWQTIPDVLQAAGIDWRIYQDPNNNWTGAMHGGLAFESFRNCKPGEPLYERGMRHWSLEQLEKDVLEGTLPQVSWILPAKEWSEHPSASTPIQGAEFTARVLDALTANPDVWAKTVFFLTFDENDGQFDHVPASAPPSYNADGTLAGKSTLDLSGFYFSDPERKYQEADDRISGTVRPWGLGARVPMYIISPWSRGGWVSSEVADHTSVGQFLEKRFDVTIPAISPWHRAVCSDLTSAFDFVSPNDPSFPELPDMSGSSAAMLAHIQKPQVQPPETPQSLYQETGMRPSRALPYVLKTKAEADAGTGHVTLAFANEGTAGAVFHVYDRLHLDRIPRRYTVEAGKSLSDVWETGEDAGRYDLFVLGPNGFMRTYVGSLSGDGAMPEVEVQYEPDRRRLKLNLSNVGKQACELALADMYGVKEASHVKLAPGASVQREISLEGAGNWYDLALTGEGFERRLAGRMETGSHSISDPAMGTPA